MSKIYNLLYGVFGLSREEVINRLTDLLDVEFSKKTDHHNCIAGVFFGASVSLCDNCSAATGTWMEIDESEFLLLLALQVGAGKQKDKLSIYKHLKQILGEYDYLTLLKDEAVEKDNQDF